MLLSILTFLVGLVLIVKGADWLTDGASSIARSFNIPSIVIGLTIVAFGTSAPELTVSVVSAINGQAEMAIGNVVGSNIFNSLAIMGITALIYPVACSAQNIRYDVPLALIASIALVAQVLDGSISLGDGIVLLCFFAIFMSYTMSQAKGQRTTDNGQRTTVNGQRSMVNRQRTTDNGQRSMVNGQWSMINCQIVRLSNSKASSRAPYCSSAPAREDSATIPSSHPSRQEASPSPK